MRVFVACLTLLSIVRYGEMISRPDSLPAHLYQQRLGINPRSDQRLRFQQSVVPNDRGGLGEREAAYDTGDKYGYRGNMPVQAQQYGYPQQQQQNYPSQPYQQQPQQPMMQPQSQSSQRQQQPASPRVVNQQSPIVPPMSPPQQQQSLPQQQVPISSPPPVTPPPAAPTSNDQSYQPPPYQTPYYYQPPVYQTPYYYPQQQQQTPISSPMSQPTGQQIVSSNQQQQLPEPQQSGGPFSFPLPGSQQGSSSTLQQAQPQQTQISQQTQVQQQQPQQSQTTQQSQTQQDVISFPVPGNQNNNQQQQARDVTNPSLVSPTSQQQQQGNMGQQSMSPSEQVSVTPSISQQQQQPGQSVPMLAQLPSNQEIANLTANVNGTLNNNKNSSSGGGDVELDTRSISAADKSGVADKLNVIPKSQLFSFRATLSDPTSMASLKSKVKYTRFQIWWITSKILESLPDKLKPDYVFMMPAPFQQGIPAVNMTQVLASSSVRNEVRRALIEQSPGMLPSQLSVIMQRVRLSDPTIIKNILSSSDPSQILSLVNPRAMKANIKIFIKTLLEMPETGKFGITSVQAKLLPKNLLATWLHHANQTRWTALDLLGQSPIGSQLELQLALFGLSCQDIQSISPVDILPVINQYRRELYNLRFFHEVDFPCEIRRCVLEKVLDYLTMKGVSGTGHILENLSPPEARAIGGEVLSAIPTSALKSVNDETQRLIIQEIGRLDTLRLLSFAPLNKLNWYADRIFPRPSGPDQQLFSRSASDGSSSDIMVEGNSTASINSTSDSPRSLDAIEDAKEAVKDKIEDKLNKPEIIEFPPPSNSTPPPESPQYNYKGTAGGSTVNNAPITANVRSLDAIEDIKDAVKDKIDDKFHPPSNFTPPPPPESPQYNYKGTAGGSTVNNAPITANVRSLDAIEDIKDAVKDKIDDKFHPPTPPTVTLPPPTITTGYPTYNNNKNPVVRRRRDHHTNEDKLSNLGNLYCYSSNMMQANMNNQTMKDFLEEKEAAGEKTCCLDKFGRLEWSKFLKSIYGENVSAWSEFDLTAMGDLLISLSPDELAQVSSDNLAKVVMNMIDNSGFGTLIKLPGQASRITFAKACSLSLGDSESGEFLAVYKNFMKVLAQGAERMLNDTGPFPRITCDGLNLAGQAAIGYTVADLKTMPHPELFDCIETLGSLDWEKDEKFQVFQFIKDNFDMSHKEMKILGLIELGNLVSAFSENEVREMDLTIPDNMDALAVFGAQVTDPTVLKALADKFTLDNRILPGGPTSFPLFSNLRMMISSAGNIICGMSDSSLQNLFRSDPTLFMDTSPTLGLLEGCSFGTLSLLSSHAIRTSNYGPPEAWNIMDVRTIGVVVAGLRPGTIARIQPDSMEGLSVLAIKSFPSASVLSLTPSQLMKLSPDVALAINQSLVDIFSNEQRDAFKVAIAIERNSFIMSTTNNNDKGNPGSESKMAGFGNDPFEQSPEIDTEVTGRAIDATTRGSETTTSTATSTTTSTTKPPVTIPSGHADDEVVTVNDNNNTATTPSTDESVSSTTTTVPPPHPEGEVSTTEAPLRPKSSASSIIPPSLLLIPLISYLLL